MYASGKGHLLPVIRSRSPRLSTHCILVLESPRKTQKSSTGQNNASLNRDKTEQDGHQSPKANRFLLAAHTGQLVCVHTSHAAVEGPHPSPWGTNIVLGLASCHITHVLKQDKGVHTEYETGRVISI